MRLFIVVFVFFGIIFNLCASQLDSEESLEAEYHRLTSLESQHQAENLYNRWKNPPKPKRKKRDRRQKNPAPSSPDYLLEQSARLGYIPALIARAEKNLSALKQEYDDQQKKLTALENELGTEKSGGSILEAHSQFNDLFQLSYEHISDLEGELTRLKKSQEVKEESQEVEEESQEVKEEGREAKMKFSYDYSFLQENNLTALCFTGLDSPPTKRKIHLPEIEKTFLRHSKSLKNFNENHKKLKSEIEALTASSPEGKLFVQKIQEKFHKYSSIFTEKIKELKDLLSSSRFQKFYIFSEKPHLEEVLNGFDWDLHLLNREYEAFSNDVFSVIHSYSHKKYAIHPSVFNDIRKITEKITSVVCCYEVGIESYDHDENFLYLLAKSYITSYESSPLGADSLRERTAILKEAERYLGILIDNPQEYLRITNPKYFLRIKEQPNFSQLAQRARNNSSSGVYEPEFSTSLYYLSNRVQVDLLKSYFCFVNELHPSYRTTLQNSKNYENLREFINFAQLTRSIFMKSPLAENITALDQCTDFYKYSGQKQNIWVHKKRPFSIRISKENNKWVYRVGFLKSYPYDPKAKKKEKKWLKIIDNERKRVPLVTHRDNELFKFSFVSEVIIPSTLKYGWATNEPKKIKLMDGAHGAFKN